MARMSRPESKARTRDDLVRTARDLFIADGLDRTSLAQVAEAAGYSKGAVYSNFRSKNDLCLEVLELIHAENLTRIKELHAGPGTTEQRVAAVREWARTRVEDVRSTRLEFELSLASRDDARLRAQLAANLAALRAAIAELLASLLGAPGSERTARAGEVLFSTAYGVSMQRVVDETISVDLIADLIPALLAATGASAALKDVQDVPAAARTEKLSKSKPVSTRSDESRAALVHTARAVFGVKRFDEVSTTEIAQRAGTAIGLINYHFGGKRGLYLAAAEAEYAEFWDALQALRGPAVARLIQGLDLFIDQAEAKNGSPLALSTRVADPELRALHEQHFDRLITAMLQETTGGPGTALARTAVSGWMAYVEGAVADWLRHRDLTRVQLRELLLAGLFSAAQSVLAMDPTTPLSSRAINALLEQVQPQANRKSEHQ
ncbi:TetR/AcrR family transcriptional regulator [Nocardia yamanashiensis]|uniref:TetR/AcrR family transcriptional regulator n=1 Tax=Nocardia yamanashiensis TaxID=209247 RepID=UPI001E35B970|nr:TetR/AcrR family transcriptional regulator [Nocardia yamanashiensis]UGT42329.1 TetR/AcrR family transcriptional regulator [Nocardia yamanashiensis]